LLFAKPGDEVAMAASLPVFCFTQVTAAFFIVGPTATGKSEIAADVACAVGGEVVSADAFQIYRGLDLLSAKPDAATVAKAPHHLIGSVDLNEEMNAQKFRGLALTAIGDIQRRGKLPIVVGGSGLYIKAITHGFTISTGSDHKLRNELNPLNVDQLTARLRAVDPAGADRIDAKNKRRLVRALEIACTGSRVGCDEIAAADDAAAAGVFVFRDRDDLYARINHRVETMFESGVVEEVIAAGEVSETASKMIGVQEIRDFLAGKMDRSQCVAAIQQRTRHYGKRQLTWFRHQSSFEPLNLSLLKDHSEVVESILQKARRSLAPADD
jgi:tRNA dimethylallyltransferase